AQVVQRADRVVCAPDVKVSLAIECSDVEPVATVTEDGAQFGPEVSNHRRRRSTRPPDHRIGGAAGAAEPVGTEGICRAGEGDRVRAVWAKEGGYGLDAGIADHTAGNVHG